MIKINEDYSYTDYCQFVLTNTFGMSHLMVSSPPQALERTDVETIKRNGICLVTPLGFGI